MTGPACQTQWPLKWHLIAGLMHVRQLLSHAPADRALPRTSATCTHAAPCTLIHYTWLQWTTSTTLQLLLTPSHRPHSSTIEVRLAITDHRLAATDHRRAPLMPPQRPPVSRPSSRAAIRRPPPQDVALIALSSIHRGRSTLLPPSPFFLAQEHRKELRATTEPLLCPP
jgi:hypothetical protein